MPGWIPWHHCMKLGILGGRKYGIVDVLADRHLDTHTATPKQPSAH